MNDELEWRGLQGPRLRDHLDLLWLWSLRSVKSRYAQTVLGGMWAVVQPLSTMVVFSIIFGGFMQVETGDVPYPVFSYTALLPWSFFSAGVVAATTSLVDNIELVTKVSFPRSILPFGAIASRFVDFAIGGVIFVGLLIYYRISPTVFWLWIPGLVVLQVSLMAGLGLILAILTVFVRDLRHAVQLIVQLWMYATPVIYPADYIPSKWQWLYSLNPMVGIIESYRAVILHSSKPPLAALSVSLFVTVVLCLLGHLVFRRWEKVVADIV